MFLLSKKRRDGANQSGIRPLFLYGYEEQKEPVSKVMMTAQPVNAIEEKVPESIEMETDSEVADVVENHSCC
ncbi:SNF2 family protein [Streptococcus viridans]|uniref:SNF2 family protein n=1 Tax=Streptococcus viridans TaxID=78535 RepID=A0ABD7NGY5_9STRE|nr:SNF2 family protein [Streptococcus viridans]